MRRPRQSMPADVAKALRANKLTTAYRRRPAYQRNDYLGWIAQAKLPATRRKRIDRMVAELKKGGVYMGMAHKPSARKTGKRR
jgi:uncharacterized protein YdeI (YjbR/CyaY-like superfamily)